MAMFSHLLGLARGDLSATAKAEDDDKRDDKSDEKKDAKAKAEADDDKGDPKDDQKSKAKSKAKAEDDKDEKDDEDAKETKAKAFADGMAAGVAAERKRATAILSAKEAGTNPALAAQLVCTTGMEPEAAIAVMSTAGSIAPQQRAGLAARMAEQKPIRVGADAAPAPSLDTPEGAAASVISAMNAALGKK